MNPRILKLLVWTLSSKAVRSADGVFVIPQMGLVGGPHLPKDGPAARHDFRDAKGSADFDQLAPGNHHLPAPGQGIEGQQNGGGVVVDHQGRLRPGQFQQQVLHVAVTAAPFSLFEIVFEIGIIAGHRIYLGHRLRAPGGTGPGWYG